MKPISQSQACCSTCSKGQGYELECHTSVDFFKTKTRSQPISSIINVFYKKFFYSNGKSFIMKQMFVNLNQCLIIKIIIFFIESFNIWVLLLMIAIYHQIKTPTDFWCRQRLISNSSLSSYQDIDRFLVQAGIDPHIFYLTIIDFTS